MSKHLPQSLPSGPAGMCSASLPPLASQPQWPRVMSLDNIPHTSATDNPQMLLPWDQILPTQEVDTNKNTAILEKQFQFLQQEHTDTLGKLHKEIEQLRRENRDLQYRLIMSEKLSEKGTSTATSLSESKQRLSIPDTKEALHSPAGPTTCAPASGEQETKEADVKAENGRAPAPSMKVDQKARPAQPSCGDGSLEEQVSSTAHTQPTQPRPTQARISVISLRPLLVNGATGQLPQAPTLLECENIIHQLWGINHTQAQELLHLKTFLKEVVYNNKWTPEFFLLAKSLLCRPPRNQDVIHFPKVTAKGESKKWVKAPVAFNDRVILPAMKQTMGNNPAERQKRSQAVQRSRLRRPVL